jgi:hypothetical protein
MAKHCPIGFTPVLEKVISGELEGPDKHDSWVLLESDGRTEQEVFDAGVELIKAHLGAAANDLHFKS